MAAGLAATSQGAEVARKVYARLEFVAGLMKASAGMDDGPRLVWREGTQVRPHPVLAGLTIGREATCDVVLESPRVSRRHCRVEVGDGEFMLRDLGSANGTRVNGGPLTNEGRRLADGDVIDVAGVPVVFFRAH